MLALMHSTVDELERKALKVWMRGVMANHNMSAYEWSKKANTSHTNITRFLNQDSKYIPSSRTIAKLVQVAGSSPHTVIPTDVSSRTIEVFDIEGVRLRYVNVHGVEGKVLAMELKQNSGYGVGHINKGDTIVIQEDADIKDMDVIMFECDDGFLVGQVMGKMIVHKSVEYNDPRNLADVKIVGKVVQCIKTF